MDPFRDIEEMRRRMNKMFQDTSGERGFKGFQRPEIDVVNKEEEITVIAEMPGVRKEDIGINAEPTHLEIKAESKKGKRKEDEGHYYRERSSKSYKRYVDLPAEVKPSKAKAEYKNGVLEVNLPKAHPEQEGKQIQIK